MKNIKTAIELMQGAPMPNDNPKSCTGCRYDSQKFLCLHPDESKPGFWEDDRVIDGRPWCYEADNKPAIERTEG